MGEDEIDVKRQTFTQVQLFTFAKEHISYEIAIALQGAAIRMTSGSALAAVPRSALLTGSLVHLRLLDDFLSRGERTTRRETGKGGVPILIEEDDVLAVDYLPDWEPRHALTEAERGAINAQVAHLAMRRAAGRAWDIIGLTNKVLRGVQEFLEELTLASSPYKLAFALAEEQVATFLEWSWAIEGALRHHEDDIDHPAGEVDPDDPLPPAGSFRTAAHEILLAGFTIASPRWEGS